jgi:hypothetical protein
MIQGMVSDEWGDVIPIDEHAALCLAAAESGSPLWQPLVAGTTFEKLVAAVGDAYAGAADALAADVDRLFAALDARGLLQT